MPQASQHQFIGIDIANRPAVAKLFAQHQFDVVVNLPARAGARYSKDNPRAYVNILGGCLHS